MFSGVHRERRLTVLRVFGVVGEAPGREVPMLNGPGIRPFDQSRLSHALARLQRMPDGHARTLRALGDLERRYEAARLAGGHGGPRLQALRLYELTWALHPRALNLDRPDRRRLLAELPAR
jgi:hypothetical protein